MHSTRTIFTWEITSIHMNIFEMKKKRLCCYFGENKRMNVTGFFSRTTQCPWRVVVEKVTS